MTPEPITCNLCAGDVTTELQLAVDCDPVAGLVLVDHPLVREAMAAGEWLEALLLLGNARRPDLIEHMLGLGMLGTRELGEVVKACWGHDPDGALLRARLGARKLMQVMRAARFEHPFSEPTTIYRGEDLFWVSPAPRSWTLSAGCAAWFATVYPSAMAARGRFRLRTGRRPVVMAATVNPGDVLLWSDERNEDEVVPARVYRRKVWEADRDRLAELAAGWKAP